MRTTLILHDSLVEEAKKKAAAEGTSLSFVVNEALRCSLKSSDQGSSLPDFQILTFRPQAGKPVDTSPSEMIDLIAAEESKPYGIS